MNAIPSSRKILVIQLRQLGDILLTTPCLRAIKAEEPGCHLTFLSHRMGRAVLSHNPHIDELLTYHESDSWREHLRRWRYLRRQRFDLVLDFMNNPRSALFSLASNAPRRASFRQRLFAAYNTLVPRETGSTYIVRYKFALLQHHGFSPQDEGLVFGWQPSDLAPVAAFCARYPHFKQGQLRVILSPSHRRPLRKWPGERFSALADLLVREWGAQVTWAWGPGGEEQEIDRLQALCQEKTYKAPASTLSELAAFIAQHDLFIGNSNGPSHLAVAVDICSLQLHGHTDALAWCPNNSQHQYLQSPEYGLTAHPSLAPLSLATVWEKLLSMRPVIEQQAATRQLIACKEAPR